MSEKAAEKHKEDIIFYCKDCYEIVKTDRCGNKYVYKCKRCGTKNVAFGTPKSIYGYFRLEDEKGQKKRDDEPKEDSKVRVGTVG